MTHAPELPGLVCRIRKEAIRYAGPVSAAVAAKLIDPARVPIHSNKWNGVFRFGRSVEPLSDIAVAEVMVDHGEVIIYLWAHVVDGVVVEPASMAHLPRIEGSNVVMLPTAAALPVVQPKRRGGFPKKVSAIWRGRMLCNAARAREAEIAKALETASAYRESAEKCQAYAAELQACARRGLPRVS